LQELKRTLGLPRIQRYLTWSRADLDDFLTIIPQTARVVYPSRRLSVIKYDPADNRVLEAAVEGAADYIVSGDQDLLDLKSYEGISIVTPARFAAILVASSEGPSH
jgi:putative PIN family toxin of toxin-antitoxin system